MVGKEVASVSAREVDKSAIRRFVESINDKNPLWVDEEYAATTRYGGIVAPPTFLRALMRPPVDVTKHERPARTSPLPTNRVVNGGVVWELREPIRVGDRITSVTRLAEITEKASKSGKIAIEVTETTYTNQHGRVVAISRDTLIYR